MDNLEFLDRLIRLEGRLADLYHQLTFNFERSTFAQKMDDAFYRGLNHKHQLIFLKKILI